MYTILVDTSTTGRNGLKPSSVAAKQVRDQVEKMSKKVVGHEGDGRSPIKDKGKSKVEEIPKKKQKFFTTEKDRLMVVHHLALKPKLGRN